MILIYNHCLNLWNLFFKFLAHFKILELKNCNAKLICVDAPHQKLINH